MLNLIMLAAMATMFGFNPVAGRALAGIIEPGQLSLLRWIIAGGLILALVLVRGQRERWQPAPASWWALVGIGAVGMGFCSYAAFAGTKTTGATNVSLIYATTAAFVLAIEWLLRQSRASLLLILGVLACLSGAAVIITKGHPESIAQMRFTIGDLWALAGTLGWTFYTIAMKRTRTGLSPFVLFVATALGGIAFSLPVALFEVMDVGLPRLSWRDIGWIASMILFSGIGAFLAYNWCLARVGPVMTSAGLTLNSLATALLATVLVGEALALHHAVGGALVIGGLALINLDRARADRSGRAQTRSL